MRIRGDMPNTVARRSVTPLPRCQDRVLRLDLGHPVQRDRAAAASSSVQNYAGLANSVAGIGGRIDHHLRLANSLEQRDDGVQVGGPGRDRVLLAQRRADERGQRDDDIGARHQLVQNALVARVAADRVEAGETAAGRQFGGAAGKGVEHGHLVAMLQQGSGPTPSRYSQRHP